MMHEQVRLLAEGKGGGGLARRLLPHLLAVGILLPIGLALTYLLNVTLARALPVREFGTFTFALSLATVLALAASLGFSQSMMRLVPTCRAGGEHGLLLGLLRDSSRLVWQVALVLAVALMLLTLPGDNSSLDEAVRWAALLLPVLAIDFWRESTMRGLHQSVAAILPRQVLLPLGCMVMIVLGGFDSALPVLALYLALFALLEWAAFRRLRQCLGFVTSVEPVSDQRRWLRISLPMACSGLASHGIRNWDIVLVGLWMGMADAGLYTAAARTALLVSLILRTLNLAIAPVMAELHHGADHRGFRRLFSLSLLGLALFGIPLYILVLVYAADILALFGAGYRDAGNLLRILATGEFVNLLTGPAGLALTMSSLEWSNMRFVLAAALLSLVALALLVPLYGLVGAAIATASATIFLSTMQFSRAIGFIYGPGGRRLVRDAAAP